MNRQSTSNNNNSSKSREEVVDMLVFICSFILAHNQLMPARLLFTGCARSDEKFQDEAYQVKSFLPIRNVAAKKK